MLMDHTKAALDLILDDMRSWGMRFRIAFAAVTSLYMLYAILAPVGHVVLNSVLLALMLGYTVCAICLSQGKLGPRVRVWLHYRWVRIALRAFALGTTLYGAYAALTELDGWALLISLLSVITWVLEVVIALLVTIAEPKIKLIYAGFLEDTRPINKLLGIVRGEDSTTAYEEHRREIDRLADRVSATRIDKPNFLSRTLDKLLRHRKGDVILDGDSVSSPSEAPTEEAPPALPPAEAPRRRGIFSRK